MIDEATRTVKQNHLTPLFQPLTGQSPSPQPSPRGRGNGVKPCDNKLFVLHLTPILPAREGTEAAPTRQHRYTVTAGLMTVAKCSMRSRLSLRLSLRKSK